MTEHTGIPANPKTILGKIWDRQKLMGQSSSYSQPSRRNTRGESVASPATWGGSKSKLDDFIKRYTLSKNSPIFQNGYRIWRTRVPDGVAVAEKRVTNGFQRLTVPPEHKTRSEVIWEREYDHVLGCVCWEYENEFLTPRVDAEPSCSHLQDFMVNREDRDPHLCGLVKIPILRGNEWGLSIEVHVDEPDENRMRRWWLPNFLADFEETPLGYLDPHETRYDMRSQLMNFIRTLDKDKKCQSPLHNEWSDTRSKEIVIKRLVTRWSIHFWNTCRDCVLTEQAIQPPDVSSSPPPYASRQNKAQNIIPPASLGTIKSSREAPNKPEIGQVWHDALKNELWYWRGGAWIIVHVRVSLRQHPPLNPYHGQQYIDTRDGILRVWDSTTWRRGRLLN